MRHTALTVIHEEHQALAAMLRSMQMLVSQAQRDDTTPNFGVLRAMLLYIDEYPERRHHPQESALLFPKVRERCPALAATLDQLDADHRKGESAVRDLGHALLAWEVLGTSRRDAFVKALERYIAAYMQHMSVEEKEILPAAREHLTDADWAVVDAAFAANQDPLAGHRPKDAPSDEYAPLFQRILNEAPAPIGLG
jgi:hemerythrin-like domain-containing protein